MNKIPQAILLSKRANVFYIEHAKVIQKDNRVVFLTQEEGNQNFFFNIPEKNTIFILLGTGTSISNQAMRLLSASNVIVGFCGSGGTPLSSITDITFLNTQDEYRPTEYMQKYIKHWIDDDKRLSMAKELLKRRIDITQSAWDSNDFLSVKGIKFINVNKNDIESCSSVNELLLFEARCTKRVYALLASSLKINKFVRDHGTQDGIVGTVNDMLDHGNYLAYGYAAATLHCLGISYAFPILHGKTRRGALVFDIADLIKDGYVLPFAFEYGYNRKSNKAFRYRLIEHLQRKEVMDIMFEECKILIEKSYKKQ